MKLRCDSTILIIMGQYLPSKKDGGPVRSIKNLIEALGDEYKFKIIAFDRDYGEARPYNDINHDEWNCVGKANVWYIRPNEYSTKFICEMAKEVELVYVCGCFDNYALSVLWLNKIKKIKKPIIIAPMGNFSHGALELKYYKKKMFFITARMFKLFHNIIWSCTSIAEVCDVKDVLGEKTNCMIAQDLPSKILDSNNKNKYKRSGSLKICFLSRICRIKNLIYTIKNIKDIKGNIEFSIYGNIEDEKYWSECKDELKNLPKNIKWEYKGLILANEVIAQMRNEHVFILPTLGENFGHAIFEALASGCIVVISDQTPWQDIESAQVGWPIPLSDTSRFQEAIQKCVDMNSKEYNEYSFRAFEYAKAKQQNGDAENQYRVMFEEMTKL